MQGRLDIGALQHRDVALGAPAANTGYLDLGAMQHAEQPQPTGAIVFNMQIG
jgi:hypothetical protein